MSITDSAATVGRPASGSTVELLLRAEDDPAFKALHQVGPYRLARTCGKYGVGFDYVQICAFSSDSRWLAIAARNEVVTLSTETWTAASSVTLPPTRGLEFIDYLADGALLVIDDEGDLYRLRPGASELEAITLTKAPPTGYDVTYALDRDNAHLACIQGNTGRSTVIDLNSGNRIAHEDKLTSGLGVPLRISQAAAVKAVKKKAAKKKATKKKTTAKKSTAAPRKINITIDEIAIDPHGRYTAFVTSVGYVAVIELATGTEIGSLLLQPRKTVDRIVTGPGARLIALEYSSCIEIWDLHTGLRVCELPFKRSAYVNEMRFAPTGNALLVAFDGCVLQVDIVDDGGGQPLRPELIVLVGDGEKVLGAEKKAPAKKKATKKATKKKAVRPIDDDDFDDHDFDDDDDDDLDDDDDDDLDDDDVTTEYNDAFLSPNRRYAVTTVNGLVMIIDRESGTVRQSPPTLDSYAFRVSPNGRFVTAPEHSIVGASFVTVWDADTGVCVARLPDRDVDAECAVSDDGSTLALFRDDGGFEVHALTADGPVLRMRKDLDSDYPTLIALSRDGARAACTCSDELLHVFEVASGKELLKVKASSAMSMSMTLDGRLVAIAQSLKKETVCLYDIATGKQEWKATISRDFENIDFTEDGTALWCVSEQYIDLDDDDDGHDDDDDDDDEDDDEKPVRLDLQARKVELNPTEPPPAHLRKPARDVLRTLHGHFDLDSVTQSRDDQRLIGLHNRGVVCVFELGSAPATADTPTQASTPESSLPPSGAPVPGIAAAPSTPAPPPVTSATTVADTQDGDYIDASSSLVEAIFGVAKPNGDATKPPSTEQQQPMSHPAHATPQPTRGSAAPSPVTTTDPPTAPAATESVAGSDTPGAPTSNPSLARWPTEVEARRAALQAGIRSDMAVARHHLDLTWLTSIDPQQAEIIATWAAGATDAREITLAGLTTLDAESARALSIWAAGNTGFAVLTLDGLTSLDAATARALASWALGNLGPCRLSLDGLTTLDADTADALADWARGNGGTCALSLNGLTSMDVEVARALARWTGGNRGGCTLSLSGLTALDALASWTLADWARGDAAPRELVLAGVTAIDTGIAHALGAWARGNTGTCKLDLSGLTSLDPNTASALAAWAGGNVGECTLSLDGMRMLDGPTAEKLATWSGDNAAPRTLSLNGLAGMDQTAQAHLHEWAERPNRTLQCWANV